MFIADYEGLPNDEKQNLVYVATDFEVITITAIAGANIRVIETQTDKQITATENEKSPFAIRYYPNPVVNELQIELPSTWVEGQISIFEPSGRLLSVHKINAPIANISFESFKTGIYFITISKKRKPSYI